MKKITIIIATILLCTITVLLYSKYRTSSFEPVYIGFLTVENSGIVSQLNDILEKMNIATIRNEKDLATKIEQLIKSLSQLSLIAITDKEYNVLIAGKKDKIINYKTFDAIINDISQKKLLPSTTFPQITRYYNNEKFFFFTYTNPTYIIITAYRFVLPKNLIIKLALENLLIVIVFLIIGTAIIINTKKEIVEPTSAKIEKIQSINPLDTLFRQFSLTSITIAQQNKKGLLKTIYSYPDEKHIVHLQEEIINELKSGSHILTTKNTVLLLYSDSLDLFFRLERNEPFKGKMIQEIKLFLDEKRDPLIKQLKIKKK